MIHIHLYADGPRDEATIPHLVARILETEVSTAFSQWARLNTRGSGYPRKLLFAIRKAKDDSAHGVVAVVDRDRAPREGHLRELKQAREQDRQKATSIPTALGEADPHGEAWLIDDPVAVRLALRLASDFEVPDTLNCGSPKKALDELIRNSESKDVRPIEVLADVARYVEVVRCNHRKVTGFRDFVEEVQSEFRHLKLSERVRSVE